MKHAWNVSYQLYLTTYSKGLGGGALIIIIIIIIIMVSQHTYNEVQVLVMI